MCVFIYRSVDEMIHVYSDRERLSDDKNMQMCSMNAMIMLVYLEFVSPVIKLIIIHMK